MNQYIKNRGGRFRTKVPRPFKSHSRLLSTHYCLAPTRITPESSEPRLRNTLHKMAAAHDGRLDAVNLPCEAQQSLTRIAAPFTKLPLELRQQVYREVWREEQVSGSTGTYNTQGILLASKQTRSEALPFFEQCVTMMLYSTWLPLLQLSRTRPIFESKHIQDIFLDLSGERHPDAAAVVLRSKFPSLRRVTFYMDFTTYNTDPSVPEQQVGLFQLWESSRKDKNMQKGILQKLLSRPSIKVYDDMFHCRKRDIVHGKDWGTVQLEFRINVSWRHTSSVLDMVSYDFRQSCYK